MKFFNRLTIDSNPGSWYRPKEWVFEVTNFECGCKSIWVGWFEIFVRENSCKAP